MKQTRKPFEEIADVLYRITHALGFGEEEAHLIAETHVRSSADGIYSHGLNRFPQFVAYVKAGHIDPGARIERISKARPIEQWDGHLGSGVVNAHDATKRAIELAKSNGIGTVALRNTNHWMRGGTYGWQAADQGCILIAMTNTIPNMAPWGGKTVAIGNNPLVIAVPRTPGHLVLDMATSQYSFGRMEDNHRAGEKMEYAAGWDTQGNLTDDPGVVLQSWQALPAGFWKGSGLSIMMDLMVSLISQGLSSHEIGRDGVEKGISQLFICFDVDQLGDQGLYKATVQGIIDSIQLAVPREPGEQVFYPGERTLMRRQKNMESGIPVDDDIWQQIVELAVPEE